MNKTTGQWLLWKGVRKGHPTV